jgi:hypothetical protein
MLNLVELSSQDQGWAASQQQAAAGAAAAAEGGRGEVLDLSLLTNCLLPSHQVVRAIAKLSVCESLKATSDNSRLCCSFLVDCNPTFDQTNTIVTVYRVNEAIV